MALTPEQVLELKKQLAEQITNLPQDQKAQAQEQIDSMSPEALESMLNQQKTQQSSQKIFRMIINKEIPSVSIDEDSSALAVLSTKSISKGHTIIIPKQSAETQEELEKATSKLAEQVSKKLIDSLKLKSTSLIPENLFDEFILNIIPIYDTPLSLDSPRSDIKVEELEKTKQEINIVRMDNTPKEKIKIEKEKKPKPIKLSRKIP